ncbi:hypothetical protein T484DRAFT_1640198, partial [Baffinella frigidus]
HPQPSTLNHQPSTLHPPPSTLNPPPSTLNLNLQPPAVNPPSTSAGHQEPNSHQPITVTMIPTSSS